MNSSLLVSESVFVGFEAEVPPNQEDQIDELKSLTWAQLISMDKDKKISIKDSTDNTKSLENSSVFSSVNPTNPSIKENRIEMTQMEAMRLLNLAASLLQANIKRYFQQKKYQHFLLQYKAAIKIQALWRGYHTRCLNLQILHLKHEFFVRNLQKRILDMDEKYVGKISQMESEKVLFINILTNLVNDIQDLKNISPVISPLESGRKTSVQQDLLIAQKKESGVITDENDEGVIISSKKNDDTTSLQKDGSEISCGEFENEVSICQKHEDIVKNDDDIVNESQKCEKVIASLDDDVVQTNAGIVDTSWKCEEVVTSLVNEILMEVDKELDGL